LKGLSFEHFGFLKNHQILDVMGVAQEGIHSIKVKNKFAMVLKLDLKKAYDMINWTFLHLVLPQLVLNLQITKWIMACVLTTNFAVLVNGGPSKFFKARRRVKKRCSLSPLLFLVIVEVLCLLVHEARGDGKIKGTVVNNFHRLTCLLFVEDVFIFGSSSMEEWMVHKEILVLFCEAMCMQISNEKSLFLK